MAPPVPALRQTRAYEIFNTTCSGCHGQTLVPGARAKSLFTHDYLDSHSDAQIVASVSEGAGIANHNFQNLFSPDEIAQMPSYLRIVSGLLNRNLGPTPDITGKLFRTEKAAFKVEVLARGFNQPWGMAFLPDGRILFTERPGRMRLLSQDGKVSDPVKGTPKVFERQDGGMFDVALHPGFARNGWIYLSYSDVPPGYVPEPGSENGRYLAPTDHDLYRAW